MVVVVFKATLRPDAPLEEYEATGGRMFELVSALPGFLGADFVETDGSELVIARFESHEALDAWRTNLEHLAAQQRGRESFYAHYDIDVCDVVRSYSFDASALEAEPAP